MNRQTAVPMMSPDAALAAMDAIMGADVTAEECLAGEQGVIGHYLAQLRRMADEAEQAAHARRQADPIWAIQSLDTEPEAPWPDDGVPDAPDFRVTQEEGYRESLAADGIEWANAAGTGDPRDDEPIDADWEPDREPEIRYGYE